MKDVKFREALDAYVDEMGFEEETLILDNHDYDKSIIGITEDGRLIYDFNKMVEEFAEDEECDETEAIEWLEYNTLRALPYMGDRAPIIIQETRESILDKYGGQ